MNIEHLQKKGWSSQEIGHAERIFAQAETLHPRARHAHIHLWLLVAIMLLASLCFSTLLFPLLLFGSLAVSLPISMVAGICVGLLFVQVLRHIGIARHHHLLGAALLLVVSYAFTALSTWLLQHRFLILPGVHVYSALLLALPFALGIAIPYALDRRLHAQ